MTVKVIITPHGVRDVNKVRGIKLRKYDRIGFTDFYEVCGENRQKNLIKIPA